MTIPWIPILSAGAGLLGSLFGNQKSTNQSENSATTGTTASTNKTQMTSNTNQQQTQTQNTNQQSSQSSTENIGQQTSEQQTGNLSRLDEGTLDMLTQAVQAGLGGDGSMDVVRRRLAELDGSTPAFDSKAYVEDIMMGARADVASQVESSIGTTQGRIGASGKSNSAAALLEAKIKNQGASTLAGIRGDAAAKAEQLRLESEGARTGQITELAALTEQGSQGLLNALLQARETQSQTGTSQSNQQSTGSTAGTTTGSTNTTGTTSEQSTQNQIQAVAETMAQQTNGNIKQGSSELKWGDLFSKLGEALASQF